MKKLAYLSLLLVLVLGSFSATTAQTPTRSPLDRLWMMGAVPDSVDDFSDPDLDWDGGLEQSGWISQPQSLIKSMDGITVAYAGNLWVLGGRGSGGAFQRWDGSTWSVVYNQQYSRSSFDGCLGLDSNGNVVVDMFGQPEDNRWSRYALPPVGYYESGPNPSGYPSTGLWAHDIVSMFQHTGDNVCYISGGATTPGGGDLNSLYRWSPASKTLQLLGQFTYASPGVAFHFSWYVPWIGTAGAICIGGGVDANGAVYADTQCYDLFNQVFLAPNADLGLLPQAWWGGGDAWKVDGSVYQLWGFNGVDANFDVLQQSFYWNGTAFVYGPQPQHAVYRMEGDQWDDSVWAANGTDAPSAGDPGTPIFNPRRWQEWLDPSAPPPLKDMYICNGSLTCTVGGGSPPVNAWAKVRVCEELGGVDVAVMDVVVTGVWITQGSWSSTLLCQPPNFSNPPPCMNGQGWFWWKIKGAKGGYAFYVYDITDTRSIPEYVYNPVKNYRPVPGWTAVCQ